VHQWKYGEGEGEEEVEKRKKMERERERRRDKPSLSPIMKVLPLVLRKETLDTRQRLKTNVCSFMCQLVFLSPNR
jgi:hypothetical protein